MVDFEAHSRNGGSNVWTIDKRISAGNLIVLAAYAIAMVYIIGQQSVRVDNIERMMAENKAQFEAQMKDGRERRDRQIDDQKAVTDQQIQDTRAQIVQIQNGSIDVAERLTKLEVKFDMVTETLKRIDGKLPEKGEQ